MNICVIIPTYNEAKNIEAVVRSVVGLNLHVLIVDDGSADDTFKIAKKCGAIVLRNECNEGKGVSLIKGFSYALNHGFDAVITMDGDGQHDAGDIAAFIASAQSSDLGVIVGNRMSNTKDMPRTRVLTNKFMSWLISVVTGQKIPDTQCGYRLIKIEVLKKMDLVTRRYEIESEILIKAASAGFKIGSVAINTIYRGQRSQINPIVDTLRFIRFIVRYLPVFGRRAKNG